MGKTSKSKRPSLIERLVTAVAIAFLISLVYMTRNITLENNNLLVENNNMLKNIIENWFDCNFIEE